MQTYVDTVLKYFHVALTWLLLGFIVGGYQGYQLHSTLHPIPMPPVPPGPGPSPPTPIPIPPAPPPKPAPIALEGFSVLIIYESSDLSKYPKEQSNILYDQNFRSTLDKYCTADPITKAKQYRIWDKDVIVADSQAWKDAMSLPHPTLPWIIISNGKTGTSEVLPKNSKDANNLVLQWFAQTQW